MVSATSTARNQNGVAPTAQSSAEGGKKTKAQPTGQKLLVRHLPPLITEEEVQAVLGEEWKTGNGKVDWAHFQPGKISKSAFKEPRPSFYSLHITKVEDVPVFKDFVLKATWQDAKNTYTMLTFQAHAQDVATRVPPTKHRVDPRQGTIDQDPEFQAYLHGLTQPKEAQSKETETAEQLASANDESSREKQVSHLVKFIQEKKAAKAKETAAAKSAKHNRQDSQGGKAKGGDDSKRKGKDSKADKSDKDKDKDKAKEPAPKLLTKKAAAQEAAAEAAKQAAGQISATKASEEAAPKSRRANIAQAAKILQRDLGLSPGSAHRRARQNAAKAEAAAPTEPSPSTTNDKDTADTAKEAETSKTVPTGPKAQGAEGSRRSRGKAKAAAAAAVVSETTKGKATDAPAKPTTGPIILLKKDNTKKEESSAAASSRVPSTASNAQAAPTPPANQAPPTGPKATAGKAGGTKSNTSTQQKKGGSQPAPGAIRAFVKHANPSQGVTEPLLKQTMETFGPVTFVEIDKRKGFAYVDFGDAEALRKAIAASPVSIAQGTVQVLERKDKKPASSAPAQPAPAEKPAAETQVLAAASAATDRPKRGNRGRGRRGGGANANTATSTDTTAVQDTTTPTAPAAG
ncbi:Smg-4/UPF3 family-domain-containing protein [Truncatella angustata]|uniref:Smg-4/UPF3 family-domain-containing protein n=1 Tax=Truncatella angustata TaxID=152316 RepID=A0A9P8ZVC4_9PEZI|nr:Smg-4/UPF3 family-domain-containing protein [Truncatella angustata]KAH6648818.1 Smg-4/UPF3 family-domain-containing protein [Truncatella angustata]KAH8200881.1 hypothetical protein TruAng_004967 [Truncatella angustata]